MLITFNQTHFLCTSCSSSTCPSPVTSAGACTTVAAATPSDPTSCGQAAAGELWAFTCSCCCCLPGRPTPVTFCWRPTAPWPSSCLQSAHGHWASACYWSTAPGRAPPLSSVTTARATLPLDSNCTVTPQSPRAWLTDIFYCLYPPWKPQFVPHSSPFLCFSSFQSHFTVHHSLSCF